MSAMPESVAGLVLAAGAGTRFGGPKGLAHTPDGEAWVARAVRTLRDGGCDPVLVAVGAEADAVSALVPSDAVIVRAADWAEGLSASLLSGLGAWASGSPRKSRAVLEAGPLPPRHGTAASDEPGSGAATTGAPASALLIVTVDTPHLPVAAVERMRAHAHEDVLAQAVYRGRPGHPVLIGRRHVAALTAGLAGDRGARPYLVARGALEVECGDLWSGDDLDSR
ncbi:nucleotidyltransferase family protein [Arenivirga flava]|nr:NTP transferase domain-containing protein [Arenivirga flava]